MTTLGELKEELERIKERNRRVEGDKAWDTSYTRRIILTIFTYAAVGFYLSSIGIPDPWLNAIVPAIAFMLSTLTLPFFKKLWLKFVYKK